MKLIPELSQASDAEILQAAFHLTPDQAREAAAVYQAAGTLDSISPVAIAEVKGFGEATIRAFVAIKEISRRDAQKKVDTKPVVMCPQDAADLVIPLMRSLEQEEMWITIMDTRNRVLDIDHLYKGTANSSSIRVGELFKSAIRLNSTNVILVHNHPSGDPTPSPEDIAVTRAAVQAGKLLDIDVIDHLIIGKNSFVSLKERGLGF